MMMNGLLRRLALASVLSVVACSGGKTDVPDKPSGIDVAITSGDVGSRAARIPITFDNTNARAFTLDLRMRNLDGSTRTSFTGPRAWARLTLAPAGQIVQTLGPGGENDPNVAGPNIHFTDGVAKGITVTVLGAYGDTRVVAQNIGFVPAPPGKLAACANGKDDDGNGLADYPVDPNCQFLNDDDEQPFDAAYGTSPILYYEAPTIRDVQLGAVSPFLAKQVELQATTHKLVVTATTAQGMYVTDVTETGGSNSIFVFTFSAPFGVQQCDHLTRLSGNVADFFGMLQLGTPGYTTDMWLNPTLSGPCPIPDFTTVDGTFAAIPDRIEALESTLIRIANPVIGTKFGKEKVPVVSGTPQPADGKSNCDLNGDNIVGFSKTKAGYSDLEKACNDACQADPDCSEWNEYVSRQHVKIKFQPGDATLYFEPSAIPGFDVQSLTGPGKIAEIRGMLTNFVGPTPAYSVEPRCLDDVILVGTPPDKIKDSKTSCVKNRIGIDTEGMN